MVFQDNFKNPAWIAGIWLTLLFNGCSQNTVVPEGEVPPGMEGGPPMGDPGMMPPMSMGQHVVQKGDTMYGIARQYGLNFRDLAAMNGIGAPYTIHPGQTLMLSPGGVSAGGGGDMVIPIDMGDMPPANGGGYAQPVYTEPAPTYAPPPVSASGYYTVQRGDTLYSIASRMGYHYRDLAAWNGLQPPYTLSAGQNLRVAPSSAPVMAAPVHSAPVSRSGVHTVQPGDTVYSLSRRYGMSVGQLAQMNGLNPPYNLRVGQPLRVSGASASSSSAKTVRAVPASVPARQFYHVAQPGEGIDSIAMRYKVSPLDIATWNGMTAPYYVNPGQRLLILSK